MKSLIVLLIAFVSFAYAVDYLRYQTAAKFDELKDKVNLLNNENEIQQNFDNVYQSFQRMIRRPLITLAQKYKFIQLDDLLSYNIKQRINQLNNDDSSNDKVNQIKEIKKGVDDIRRWIIQGKKMD